MALGDISSWSCVNLDFAPEYQNWEKTDCLDLFGAKTIRKEASGGVIRHLKDVGRNVYALYPHLTG